MLRGSAVVLLLGSALMSVPASCQDGPSYPPARTVSIPVIQGTSSAPQSTYPPAPYPASSYPASPGNTAGSEWDQARARLMQTPRTAVGQAIERWRSLSSSDRFGFTDYSSFLLAYPGYPDEAKLRRAAEDALTREAVTPPQLVAFFDRFPPIGNLARAQYALGLAAARRPEAAQVALDAWRGGAMSDAAESYIFSTYAGQITQADHDQRMDALLWAGQVAQAQRQVLYTSQGARMGFVARLGMIGGIDPDAAGMPASAGDLRDIGYVYNRERQLRRSAGDQAAAQFLATRPPASRPARDGAKWVTELLSVARSTDSASAVRIAASIDDGFAPGTDISTASFKLRDDYTSLMWLGGTKALWELGDPVRAAGLFYRYGAAAQKAQTRSKGFYWAGRAAVRAGDTAGADRYFEMAAADPEYFYGMLALERLGRPMPNLVSTRPPAPTKAEQAAFQSRPLTAAAIEVARGYPWGTYVKFYREIAEQAKTDLDHALVADLAASLGRRDLGVWVGMSAHDSNLRDYQWAGFPLIPTPSSTNWTMVHAITRQESQFAMDAVSHAGARGLMQLMPTTAREQAGKIGLSYQPDSLMVDSDYNIRLGDAYFQRMMDYFGGSYPLAVCAYNAGAGNVNKWLRLNGDPRNGGIDWVDWIERIPVSETRNYVQRVLENAVVYETMNPQHATPGGGRNNPLSRFLGKRTPG